MARRMRLSDRSVARLRAEKSEYTVWDMRVTGLGVRIRPSGYRAFIFLDRRNGSPSRHTLGPVTWMTVDEARTRCLELQSVGPLTRQQDRSSATPLFRDFVSGVWRAECLERQKPTSRRTAESALANQLFPAFGNLPLDQIRRKDAHRWFDRYSMTAPGGANRVLAVLYQIMNHAKVHGHIENNPATGVRRNPGSKMNRFLSREESIRLHAELDRCVVERPSCKAQADIIRLLYFTGCRRGEILNLRWTEIGDGVLALADSKTGPRRVYLNSAARAILERQPKNGSSFVFPSSDDSSRPLPRNMRLWTRVRRRAGIEDVRLHDLRHNFASHAVLQGVPLPTVAKLLGHRQLSMTLRYAHVHDKDVEAAAERIGQVISGICDPSTS